MGKINKKNYPNKHLFKITNKKKLFFLILLLLLLITGITYASFNVDIKGLINIKTTFPSISLTYEEAPTALNQTNSILTEEEHKISSDYFEFKVSSTSNIPYDLYYRIYLTEKTTNTLSKDNLYIYLTEVSNNTETEVLKPTKINSLRKHSTYDNSYIISSDSLTFLTETKETKEKTYRLRIWNDVTTTSNSISIFGGIYEYTVNVDTYNNTIFSTMKNQVQTTNISYKYINGANKTENSITYNNNDNGVFLFNGTDDNNGDKPIYYYRGNVTNNNVLFANMCWKIVRTTSTGGIKLIYNGLSDSNGTCNNIEVATQLSNTSKFNENSTSPADVGYMYGTRYTREFKTMTLSSWYSLAGKSISYVYVANSKSNMSSTSYYYGDSVTYSNGTYTLNNAEQHTWSTDYSNLKGYYTFFNSSTSSTTKPSYITGGTTSRAYYTTHGDEKIGMGANVTYSNGIYTITDYTLIDKKDYYSNFSTYKGYYLCPNNSNSCSKVRYTTKTTSDYYHYVALEEGETYDSVIQNFETNPWLYGNDVIYSNGTYTLVTTKTSNPLDWSSDKATLADGYHYTCFNSTGTCTTVYYIISFKDSTNMYYLKFTGGDNLDSVKTKMFTNTNDSKLKENIDNWYSTNLTGYTKYLENTIFCNDRSFASGTNGGPLSSKDINSTGHSFFAGYESLFQTYSPSLQCSNINDRFSLKVGSGGTTGYGNNALIYPVGLLTSDEVVLAGGIGDYGNNNYYLYTGKDTWVLSPRVWRDGAVANIGCIYSNGGICALSADNSLGIRPVISIKNEIEIIKGTGLSNNPYVITGNYSDLST